jgi:hypothetical protein
MKNDHITDTIIHDSIDHIKLESVNAVHHPNMIPANADIVPIKIHITRNINQKQKIYHATFHHRHFTRS